MLKLKTAALGWVVGWAAAAAALILASAACGSGGQEVPPPPATRTASVTETIQGKTVTDPYRWLEDQDSPETRAWIQSQNAYADRILDRIPGRAELKSLLTRMVRVDSVGIPASVAGRYFFFKRLADQDLSVLYMRQGLEGPDQVLLDPHSMSPDHTTSVGLMDIAKDGTLIIYAVRRGGEDEVELRLFDVDGRRDLSDVLPRAVYFGASLTKDKKGFYYARREPRGARIYHHTLGDDPSGDSEVFGSGYGPESILSAGVSENGRWLVIYAMLGASADKVEIYVRDLRRGGPIVPLVKDIPARFEGFMGGDLFYVHTNWKAPNGRILVIDPRRPDPAAWREIIPEKPESFIQGFSGAGGKLFVNYLRDVQSQVGIFNPAGQALGEISFPTIGSVGGMNGLWDGGEAFYSFMSFHIPTTIYRYEIETGRQSVWSRVTIPVDVSRFEVKQVWYKSKDGTDIPMFLVHARDLALDGSHPTLLTGYGGFNLSETPVFSVAAAAWVEQGGVYALPNLRGGGEFGEKWHRAGMLDKKQNVFDDFLAAAEYLIRNKYTSPERLAIFGGSNGGLLVGAALTQRPELFGAAVCSYPLLDMLRYHLFFMGKYWVPEYGSAEDPAQFTALFAYSPYHHVRRGVKYPAVLFITGDADTRVAPLHARKMTALLQAETGSKNPVLLRYHVKAGHSGGMPVGQQIDNWTDTLSFLLWRLK
jgi:prolyl oligopeptidase